MYFIICGLGQSAQNSTELLEGEPADDPVPEDLHDRRHHRSRSHNHRHGTKLTWVHVYLEVVQTATHKQATTRFYFKQNY